MASAQSDGFVERLDAVMTSEQLGSRSYTKILREIVMTRNNDLTRFVADFRAQQIYQTATNLIILDRLNIEMVGFLQQPIRGVDVLQSKDRWQTGFDMLIYALNFNPHINDIKLDLSACQLTDEHLKWLLCLNKRISSMDVSGNDTSWASISASPTSVSVVPTQRASAAVFGSQLSAVAPPPLPPRRAPASETTPLRVTGALPSASEKPCCSLM